MLILKLLSMLASQISHEWSHSGDNVRLVYDVEQSDIAPTADGGTLQVNKLQDQACDWPLQTGCGQNKITTKCTVLPRVLPRHSLHCWHAAAGIFFLLSWKRSSNFKQRPLQYGTNGVH